MVGRSCFWELELGWLDWWRVLDWVADLVYLADCLVRGHEGYREQGLLVRDSVLLRRRYLAQPGHWLPDILRLAARSVDCCEVCSILPTDLFTLLLEPDCRENLPCPVWVRLNRIIRLGRLQEFLVKVNRKCQFTQSIYYFTQS